MSDLGTGHPPEGDLLRFLEGEVSPREAKSIQAHLDACWQCRTELEEVKGTIGECVRYRRSVHEHLPDPPGPWFNIRQRMEVADAEIAERSLGRSVASALQRLVGTPRRWVPAISVILVIGLVVDQLRNAPSVQAAELLRKAVAAADARPVSALRLRIRTVDGQFVRVRGEARGTLASRFEPRFRAAHYSWEDPLSARSFASWRDTLAEKRDQVTKVEDTARPANHWFRIRTTTQSSSLVEASIKLRGGDLRPIESEFHFRDREWVNIAELEENDPTPPLAPAVEMAAREPAPSPPPVGTPVRAERELPATPGDELRVLAALHRLNADLGEPVEVKRSASEVLVTGIGVNPRLRGRIEQEMRGLPRVAVQFTDPQAAPLPPVEPASDNPQRNPDAARRQLDMEKRLGGRGAYDQFANQVLETGDSLMSRAHALRRLAERFPPKAEAELDAEGQATLRQLRREHATALAGLAVRLEQGSRASLIAMGARVSRVEAPPSTSTWQQAAEDLFRDARHTESLLAVMLGGATGDTTSVQTPGQVLAAIEQLKARAEQYAGSHLD